VLKIAALAVAAATATQTPALKSTAPWWERITVTVGGDGKPQGCQYEASHRIANANNCEVVSEASPVKASATGPKDQFTRITFERRFIPGLTVPGESELDPGETLLGSQVMALAIDGAGAVKGCKIVSSSGAMTPSYGCNEAQSEQFERTAGAAPDDSRLGFMTVLVYGHAENLA
jgi:hypothetical protein